MLTKHKSYYVRVSSAIVASAQKSRSNLAEAGFGQEYIDEMIPPDVITLALAIVDGQVTFVNFMNLITLVNMPNTRGIKDHAAYVLEDIIPTVDHFMTSEVGNGRNYPLPPL